MDVWDIAIVAAITAAATAAATAAITVTLLERARLTQERLRWREHPARTTAEQLAAARLAVRSLSDDLISAVVIDAVEELRVDLGEFHHRVKKK